MVGRGFSVKFKNKAKTSTTAALSCTTKDSFSKITKEEKKNKKYMDEKGGDNILLVYSQWTYRHGQSMVI